MGLNFGPLAQSVEQRTFNPWVVGSIPTGPTLIHGNHQKSLNFDPNRKQHLTPFGVLLSRGVKTLAQLKAGNQSVTS